MITYLLALRQLGIEAVSATGAVSATVAPHAAAVALTLGGHDGAAVAGYDLWMRWNMVSGWQVTVGGTEVRGQG